MARPNPARPNSQPGQRPWQRLSRTWSPCLTRLRAARPIKSPRPSLPCALAARPCLLLAPPSSPAPALQRTNRTRDRNRPSPSPSSSKFGRSRPSPPPVSTSLRSSRSPLSVLPLGQPSRRPELRRFEIHGAPSNLFVPVRACPEVGDGRFAFRSLENYVNNKIFLVSWQFSRKPPTKIPPFTHKSHRAVLQI